MLKAAMDRGEPLDASLAALRQQGASIIDSIKAVRETNLAVSLSEAKRLVEASSAWEGGREARGQFVDEITTPHGASSQIAGIGLLTIRDLLWLAAVIALSVGWWLDHRTLAPHAADANDKQQMAKLIGTMKLEIDLYKELVATYEKEREELKALSVDRNL
jgi:hypothetical protein